MNKISFVKKLVLVASIALFASCDKDFNSVGSDIVGEDHFKFDIDSTYKIVAFNTATGPVQTNNLPLNSLGVYNNPAFGKTTANFVTQLSLAEVAPAIGNNPKVEEVILYIPYFSTQKGTNEDGSKEYTLDSIYGSSKIKLSIYESRYYLRDFDPNNEFDKQRYYSDQNAVIDANKGQLLNDSSDEAQNEKFVFSSAEHIITEGENEETLKPGMRLILNKEFFQQKLFDGTAAEKLVNNNIFHEYLRGLYFQVENAASEIDGIAMSKIDFAGGTITIKYKEDAATGTEGKVDKTIVLNLKGNTINVFENTYKSEYTNALVASNPTLGDEKLYVKGGEGSVAYIDLFDDIQLEEIRAKRWLINEANLEFYIDKAEMNGSKEPIRIYLYDTKKNTPILDYYYDGTTNVRSKFNKGILGGILEKNSDGKGTKYKIRLTEHINAIVNKDSTNVRLGLVVTEDINQISNAYLKTPFGTITRLPAYSVINQLGTVLYGSVATVPENKKLKLKIYYTKPN